MVDTDMLLHRSTALKLTHVTLLLALYSFVTCHWRVSFKLANSLSTCTMDWFIALIGTDQWKKKEIIKQFIRTATRKCRQNKKHDLNEVNE